MKFYHSLAELTNANVDVQILSNPVNVSDNKSIIVITLQLINNNNDTASITFKRKQLTDGQPIATAYSSVVKIKPGTTVLDHIIVLQPGYSYTASSDLSNIVVSCSYGK